MNRISLATATREIELAAQHAKDTKDRRPFFFVVGAGISSPSVPLARKIEDRCREIAGHQGRHLRVKERASPIERYSSAFDAAFPHAVARQRYLEKLMKNVPITAANLRLAHLLHNKRVASMVVTTNFDDLLSRALVLLGANDVRVCDHPATVERINPESDDLQIVHVHGTYWFYDLCNLQGELGQRARGSDETAFTMLGLLDRILATRSPLVVGYSGWEGDVVMTALKRRLYPHRRLPYRLYWFCYNFGAVLSLPDWLRDHPDVYFVFHPDSWGLKGPGFARRQDDFLPSSARARVDAEPPLSAEMVMEQLIRTFKLDEPLLTRNPLKFLAEFLEGFFPRAEAPWLTGDIYSIHSVAESLRNAPELKRTSDLDKVRDAVRRSQYHKAVEHASGLIEAHGSGGVLSEQETRELVAMLLHAAGGLMEGSEDQCRAYDFVIGLCNAGSEAGYLLPLARAGVAKGRNLIVSGQARAAETLLAGIASLTPGDDDNLRHEVVRAAALQQVAQLGIKGTKVDREIAGELAKMVYHAPDFSGPTYVNQLLVDMGERLLDTHQPEFALKVFDLASARLTGGQKLQSAKDIANRPDSGVLDAAAWFGRIKAMHQLRKPRQVLSELRGFIKLFGDFDDAEIRRKVVYAWAIHDELDTSSRRHHTHTSRTRARHGSSVGATRSGEEPAEEVGAEAK
jgi:hypothetical protein